MWFLLLLFPVISSEFQQISLSLSENDNEYMYQSVMVSWVSNQSLGFVWFGVDSASKIRVDPVEMAKNYSYTSPYVGKYTSGYIHHVKLEKLIPNQVYYYQVGVEGDKSNDFSFVTPPSVREDAKIVFGVVGDLGQTSDSNSTMWHVMSKQPNVVQFILLVGDLSYADSGDPVPNVWNNTNTQERWDSWGRLVQPMLSSIPFVACPGNHEVEVAPNQTNYLAYTSRYIMPYKSNQLSSPLFYSFDIANAHVIMLNSYSDFSINSPQYNFLLTDLENVSRDKTPWLIVTFHAPWYNSNSAHQHEFESSMRLIMEPLFLKYRVNIVFSGHVHAYERSFPVYNETVLPNGPIYVTIGDGGNREGKANKWLTRPSWSAFREAGFGHGRLTLFNRTHAYWGWLKNENDVPIESDFVWIINEKVPYSPIPDTPVPSSTLIFVVIFVPILFLVFGAIFIYFLNARKKDQLSMYELDAFLPSVCFVCYQVYIILERESRI